MTVYNELQHVAGDYGDEVSLLNQVSGQFFQSIPSYSEKYFFFIIVLEQIYTNWATSDSNASSSSMGDS